MAIQLGKDLLLKIKNRTNASFYTFGGLRAREIIFNTTPIDVTNADSASQWRELLQYSGLRTARLRGQGVFRDTLADEYLRRSFFDAVYHEWQIIIPALGELNGKFAVTTLRYAGSFESEMRWEIELQSAGEVRFVRI